MSQLAEVLFAKLLQLANIDKDFFGQVLEVSKLAGGAAELLPSIIRDPATFAENVVGGVGSALKEFFQPQPPTTFLDNVQEVFFGWLSSALQIPDHVTLPTSLDLSDIPKTAAQFMRFGIEWLELTWSRATAIATEIAGPHASAFIKVLDDYFPSGDAQDNGSGRILARLNDVFAEVNQ